MMRLSRVGLPADTHPYLYDATGRESEHTDVAKVLIVEDDDDIRLLITKRVKAAGHMVLGAPDGEAALQAIAQRGAPEVAILDVGLPGMEGPELLVEMRRRMDNPGFPAIFLSARVNQDDVERGRALNAAYLTKPVDVTALLAAISQAVPGQARGW